MSANVTFTYTTANRWLGMRFDSVVLIVSLSCAILAMSLRDTFNGSLLIYSLQVISDVAVFFSISMRSIVEMQNYMTSFQRMHAYAQIDIEDELNKKTDPKKGEL